MRVNESGPGANPVRYFRRRARQYDRSSRWVDDAKLIALLRRLAGAGKRSFVLDVAVGTGKIAGAFAGRAGFVAGIDICEEMTRKARKACDGLVMARGERLPFRKGVFDACVCRQGLQFMDLSAACAEIHRVLKPGGRAVLCHLTPYGRRDAAETFRIQRLRNPARKNFFLRQDVQKALKAAGFSRVESRSYPTRESINRWTGNAGVSARARAGIRRVYEEASQGFRKAHRVEFSGGDIFDTMLMVIVRAYKKK